VREVGRREVPGRPVLYGTTREFLEHFNLQSLDEMPTLAELRPIEQISAELDQRLAEHKSPVSPAEGLIEGEDNGPVAEAAGADDPVDRANSGDTEIEPSAAIEARPPQHD
jgi:segregation and condensation protein B